MIGPFARKISRFSCDLTVLWKIKQLRSDAVETRLGVAGALRAKPTDGRTGGRTSGTDYNSKSSLFIEHLIK